MGRAADCGFGTRALCRYGHLQSSDKKNIYIYFFNIFSSQRSEKTGACQCFRLLILQAKKCSWFTDISYSSNVVFLS